MGILAGSGGIEDDDALYLRGDPGGADGEGLAVYDEVLVVYARKQDDDVARGGCVDGRLYAGPRRYDVGAGVGNKAEG